MEYLCIPNESRCSSQIHHCGMLSTWSWMCSRSSQEVYYLGNCRSDEHCCQIHRRYTGNHSWARYWSCDKPEEVKIDKRPSDWAAHNSILALESICNSGRSKSCRVIYFASPDKVLKKISPPRGKGRLNCRDTTLAQKSSQMATVMRCEKIVSYCRTAYQITCCREGERGGFFQKIMSMVYDKSVNSSEIIASELNQGDCNLSHSSIFLFGSPRREGRSVLTLLNLYFEEQIWWFFLSFTKGGKVGGNQNKLVCCMYPPAAALTHKNEFVKNIFKDIILLTKCGFRLLFIFSLEIAIALLDMKSVHLLPPPLSTNTPGCRLRSLALHTRSTPLGSVMLELGLLHKTSDFMAQIELCTQGELSSFRYRQVTNILEVKEKPHLVCVLKANSWLWLRHRGETLTKPLSNREEKGDSVLPDEGQRNNIVRVDGDEPVTVFAVWVGVRIVGREDEAWRSSHIPTTGSFGGGGGQIQ